MMVSMVGLSTNIYGSSGDQVLAVWKLPVQWTEAATGKTGEMMHYQSVQVPCRFTKEGLWGPFETMQSFYNDLYDGLGTTMGHDVPFCCSSTLTRACVKNEPSVRRSVLRRHNRRAAYRTPFSLKLDEVSNSEYMKIMDMRPRGGLMNFNLYEPPRKPRKRSPGWEKPKFFISTTEPDQLFPLDMGNKPKNINPPSEEETEKRKKEYWENLAPKTVKPKEQPVAEDENKKLSAEGQKILETSAEEYAKAVEEHEELGEKISEDLDKNADKTVQVASNSKDGSAGLFSMFKKKAIKKMKKNAPKTFKELMELAYRSYGKNITLEQFEAFMAGVAGGLQASGKKATYAAIAKAASISLPVQHRMLANYLGYDVDGNEVPHQNPLVLSVEEVKAIDPLVFLKGCDEQRRTSTGSIAFRKDLKGKITGYASSFDGEYKVAAVAKLKSTLGQFTAYCKVKVHGDKINGKINNWYAKGTFSVIDIYDFDYKPGPAQEALKDYIENHFLKQNVNRHAYQGRSIDGQLKVVMMNKIKGRTYSVRSEDVGIYDDNQIKGEKGVQKEWEK